MKPTPDPELLDADNPEWTDADFARAIPFAKLPLATQHKLLGTGTQAPVNSNAWKQVIPVHLSAEVVARFRVTGTGWQARVDAALVEWLRTHSPEDLPS